MSGFIRKINASDGSPITPPSTVSTSVAGWVVFANDAAYEAVHGAGQQGDAYYNSTELLIREHNGTEWVYGQNGINGVEDSASTGASQDIDTTYHNLVKLTNASLSSVRSLDPGQVNIVYVVNATGSDVTLLHDDAGATAANRLLLPDGASFALADGNTAHFVYDDVTSRWRYTNAVGGGGGDGGSGTGAKNYVLSPDDSSQVTDVGGSVSSDITDVALIPEESKAKAVLVTQTAGSIGDTSTFETDPIDEGDNGRSGAPDMYWKTQAGYVANAASIQWYNSDTSEIIYSFDVPANSSGNIALQTVKGLPLLTGENVKPRIYWNVTSETNGIAVSGAATLAQSRTVGSLITDWTSFPVVSSISTNVTHTASYKISGNEAKIRLRSVFTGVTDNATLTFDLPNSWTIDSSVANDEYAPFGSWILFDATGSNYKGIVRRSTSTSVQLSAGNSSATYTRLSSVNLNTGVPIAAASGDILEVEFTVPINEVDGSVGFGTEMQGQNSLGRFFRNAAYSYTANTTFAFDQTSTLIDVLGINNTAGVFDFDTKGHYELTFFSRSSSGNLGNIQLYKNGAFLSNIGAGNTTGEGGATVTFKIENPATDTIELRMDAAYTVNVGDGDTWIEFKKFATKSSSATGFPFADQHPGEYGMVKYWEETVTLVNSGSQNMNGFFKFVRIGNIVSYTSDVITHDNVNGATSAVEVPTIFRPNVIHASTTYYHDDTAARTCRIQSDGTIFLFYRDDDGNVSDTDSAVPVSGSYVIT